MSGIDYDLFLEWCYDHFGPENVRIRHTTHGDEICTHSFFARSKGIDDQKFHLWMNPSGGKRELESGAYRCWLTDQKGTLISLVAQVEGIPFEEAEELIGGTTSLRRLEQKVHEFFGSKPVLPVTADPEPTVSDLELPDFSFLIDGMSPASQWKTKSKGYLSARKIPTEGLYVCTAGDYKDRIVIPYYDWSGRLIFYNARTMNKNPKVLRYMKPPHGEQEKVLYMTKWPRPGSKVYVMEGEFDAMTLGICGYVGAACGGKYLSETQIEMLREYEIVLAFDADAAGLEALVNVGNTLLEKGLNRLSFIRPPKVYKDWNSLLVHRNMQTIRAYIERFEKRFTSMTADYLKMNQL